MSWRTERMAKKDVAFEAYKALYFAGLVNDNLLPVRSEADDMASEFQIPQHTPSMVPSLPTLNPWLSVAEQHRTKPQTYFRTLVEIQTVDEQPLYFRLFTLFDVPMVGSIDLFWNESNTYTATISKRSEVTLDVKEVKILQSITRKILLSIHSGHMHDERHDFMWLLAPCDRTGKIFSSVKLARWNSSTNGCQPALSLLAKVMNQPSQWGLISEEGGNRKYFLQAITNPQLNTSNAHLSEGNLQVIRVPKRRDFLHRLSNTRGMNAAYTRTEDLVLSRCNMDSLPASWAIVALLLPSIMHRIESAMIADTLRTTLLKPVDIQADDLPLLVSALTASSTYEENNYQRLEFLGDCILKFVASLHVMAQNPAWPEGYLTGKKGKLVSNGFLARATLTAGLDKFIITKIFTGAKWSPAYWGDVLADNTPPVRQPRSSKLLADVVESLIGVGYTVGGFTKAFTCIQTLLPLEKWTPVPEANVILYDAAPTNLVVTNLSALEDLIGYTFTKKMLLLEAVTHASYNGPNAHCSYERLEFFGDAILDYIISKRLYAYDPPLPHQKMHTTRTAMVNAAFIAFNMLETTVSEGTINKSTMQPEVHQRVLWQFLRSGSSQLLATRDVALRQHAKVREQLTDALKHGDEFPWHLLALVNAPKVLSDIVESVIAAIYVDSQGDFSACEAFVRRLGILDTLERIIRDDVDCLHPKERLGHLAKERDVRYVRVLRNPSNVLDLPPGVSRAYECQVKIGGESVGGVVEGLTRLHAETVAAWMVNKYLMYEKEVALGSDGEEEEFFDAEEVGGIALGDW
jgi:dsRNA-specific ribonuclease